AADTGDGEAPDGEPGASPAVGELAGEKAAEPSGRDRRRGGEPGAADGPAGRLIAREQTERRPGPHRVELPHVTQITEVGETRRPVREHPSGGAPVERRRLGEVGTRPHEESADERREKR